MNIGQKEILLLAVVTWLGQGASAEEKANPLLTALSATTVSGYVDTAAIWKFGTGQQLVGRSYDGTAKQDLVNLNAVKLSLAKPLDDSDWSAGYQFDLVMGPDAATYKAMLGYGIVTDVAIQQAHLKLKAPLGNGLYGTFGVFETPFGYEKFDGCQNAHFSRSYGYSIVPRQHTGVVLAYPVTEWLMIAGGVANTCNSPINGRPYRLSGGVAVPASETEKTYVGAIYLSAPSSWEWLKGASFTLVGGNGLNGQTTATPGHATAYYAGGNLPLPLKGLSVGAAYDYIDWTGFHASAVALYLKYQATEKLSFNNRVEYAKGSSGAWTGVLGPGGMKPAGGEKFFGETFTIEYSLWDNVLSRVEFRWDHDLTARRGVPAPFGIDDKNAFSLALNIVYKF